MTEVTPEQTARVVNGLIQGMRAAMERMQKTLEESDSAPSPVQRRHRAIDKAVSDVARGLAAANKELLKIDGAADARVLRFKLEDVSCAVSRRLNPR